MDKPASPAVARSPRLVIRASAGAGKTYQLVNRFLAILAAGHPPDAILAATFTRKAAGEIADRVLKRLAAAALNPREAAALEKEIGARNLNAARAGELLRSLVRSLHRLRIGTLDSFFVELAGAYGWELGLPPGWSIGDVAADSRLRSEALEAMLARHPEEVPVLLHSLGKGEAHRSVQAQLLDAVATMYDAYLSAPKEAWQRVAREKELPREEIDAAIAALEAAVLPANKPLLKARDENCQAARAGDWKTFLAKGIAAKLAAGETEFAKKPIEPNVVEPLRRLLAHARAVLVNQLAAQNEATYELLDRFHAEYERLKRGTRRLRFADLTHRLARRPANAAAGESSSRLDSAVDHLLLDEFQDTSPDQWAVLRPYGERTCDPGAVDRSFFCVGDVKQAIYGWRGGVAEIFDAVTHDLSGLEEQALAQSFRSAPPIIDAVNAVFQNLAANPVAARIAAAAAAWGRGFALHSTAKTREAGCVRMVTGPRAGEDEDQGEVTLQYAADEIARLHRLAPDRSLGVLVRTNASVARLMYELSLRDVRASGESGNPLTTSPAVTLILSALRLADHSGDLAARFHVATSPLAPIVGLRRHNDDAAATRAARGILQALADEGYGAVVERWAVALAESCPPNDVARLSQLVDLAREYEAEATLRPRDFVERVEHERVDDPSASTVRVMNVHQAKGLEFDIVVLPELDKPLRGQPPALIVGRNDPSEPIDVVCRYPNEDLRTFLSARVVRAYEQTIERDLREELCVLYVALTRAAHALVAIVAPSSVREKTLPATAAGLLRFALGGTSDRVAPNQTLYERGDEGWWSRKPRAAPPAPVRSVEPHYPRPPAGRSRGLARKAPSSLEGGTQVHLADRLRFDRAGAFDRGSLFHAWFEQVGWLDEGEPDDSLLLRIAAERAPGFADVRAAIAQFRHALSRPPVRAALSRSRYRLAAGEELKLQRERSFAVKLGDDLLTGAIDRLATVVQAGRPTRAEVLDYKTDRLAEGDAATLQRLLEHYRPQLEAYKRAAASLCRLPVERIGARLLFVATGEIGEV